MWPFQVENLAVNKPYKIKMGRKIFLIRNRKDIMKILRIRDKLFKLKEKLINSKKDVK